MSAARRRNQRVSISTKSGVAGVTTGTNRRKRKIPDWQKPLKNKRQAP
jgi:hypothetical protein